LHELDLTGKVDKGMQETQETQENDAEKRVRGTLELVGKVCDPFALPLSVAQLWNQLKKELDNLHLERLLDSSRAKILKALGIGSWPHLKEKATESGMALHDYVFVSLKENPIKNGEVLNVKVLEMLCTQSFVNLGNIRDIEEAYISVYGQGIGQQSA
jgi:hypothetical protein